VTSLTASAAAFETRDATDRRVAGGRGRQIGSALTETEIVLLCIIARVSYFVMLYMLTIYI